MSYQHNIQIIAETPGGPASKQNAYNSAQHAGFNDTISAGATTVPNFSVDVSQAVSMVMLCDRDVILTFNDDGTPDATINLLEGVPLVWTNDGYFDNPLGIVDITSFKATLAAGDDATLLVDVDYD